MQVHRVRRRPRPAPLTTTQADISVKITFWGAARTVTGSMHLLELENGKRVLLDCGLYQGRRSEARKINESLPFEAKSIVDLVNKIEAGKFTPLKKACPDAPKKLHKLCERMLHKDPKKRPQTVRELAVELTKCQK